MPEDGHGAVADGAGRDAVLPVLVFSEQVEPPRGGARRYDDGGRCDGFVGVLGPQFERPAREIDLVDRLGDNFGAEPLRLRAHGVHEFGAADAAGETGVVFHVRRRGQLAARRDAVGEHAFVQHGFQLRAREVDGGGVGGGAGADDDDFGVHWWSGFGGVGAQRGGEGGRGRGFGLEGPGCCCYGERDAGAEGEGGETVECFGKQGGWLWVWDGG